MCPPLPLSVFILTSKLSPWFMMFKLSVVSIIWKLFPECEIEALPLVPNTADTLSGRLILPENVETPATLTLSKFVCPSTSKSIIVEIPVILTLSKFVWPSTSKSAFRSILLRNVEIPPWTPTSKFLSTVRSRYENVEIPDVGAPVCPIYL